MRILLVKTSSLGDVVHNLPVVTDLRSAHPNVVIDWVVEEAFATIPRLHPGVNRVIPVALRRWRKTLFTPLIWRELRDFRQTIAARRYDLIIDTQGLVKSALIGHLAHGVRCGLSAASAREPFAACFYERTFDVPKTLHAVVRNRQLAALAAGYVMPAVLDYGIAPGVLSRKEVGFAAPSGRTGSTALLLTATSRADKLWPEERWIALGRALGERGLTCLLPAGNETERMRTARLAHAIPGASALPPLDLRELAHELAAAHLVIGVDTGLVHLAAALGRPTLAVFCASDPALTGVLAGSEALNLGQHGAPPDMAAVLAAAQPFL